MKKRINNNLIGKRIFAFALALGLMLTVGCKKKQEQTEEYLQTSPYVNEQQGQANPVNNITVYTFNEKTAKLESKIVAVTLYPDQTRGEAAVEYILSTPDFSFALNSYGVPDYTLTVAGGIAVVRIKQPHNFSKQDAFKCFAMHFSIVNTLCTLDGINYVSVYAGDKEMAGDVYIGPRKFLEKNLNDYYTELYGQQENAEAQRSALLYYCDRNKEYLVPEQQLLLINPKDVEKTVKTIYSKLLVPKGNTVDLIPGVRNDCEINYVRLKGDTMGIDFKVDPLNTALGGKSIGYGSISNSVYGVYPNIKQFKFTVNGAPINAGDMTDGVVPNTYMQGNIGSAIVLYLPSESLDTLYPVNGFLSSSSGISVKQILSSLSSAPTTYNGVALSSTFRGGLTVDNIISAKVVNDTAIINFDTGFYDCVKNMPPKEETAMVYSIVNTLTAREQISRVQFLINNQRFETINGHIYYSTPLFANPGIISK